MKKAPHGAGRAHCIECMGLIQYNRNKLQNCMGDKWFIGSCPFFRYRLGRRIPVKVFRAFCIHCMGGNGSFVKDCPSV